MILLPESLIGDLSAADVDRIIAHEYAHLRRGDDWINAFQRLVLALFFFNPAILYMKELIEADYIGDILAVHVSLMREGVLSRPSNRVWQRDGSLGANTLTIANGHTIDTIRTNILETG